MFSFNQELNSKLGTCIAANWLSPRHVLERFGGFDASIKSGGDTKLSRQIMEAGHLLLYCDRMIVYHPARLTLEALIAKRRRVVGGKWATAIGVGPKAKLLVLLTWDAILRARKTIGEESLQTRERLEIVAIIGALWLAGLSEIARLAAGLELRR
jgi:hypothetical protein